MVGIAKLLRWLFGYTAAACGFGTLITLYQLLSLAGLYARLDLLWGQAWSHLGISAIASALGVVCTSIYAMAWWRTGKGKGRAWAIAASLLSMLLGLSLLIVQLRLLSWLLIAIGIAGFIVFTGRNNLTQMTAQTAAQTAISDKPAHRFLAFLARWALYPVAFWCWHLWLTTSHLPASGSVTLLLLIALASLITTTVHECGHAAVGMALGMKLHVFFIGPFQWNKQRGKWRFRFRAKEILGAAIGGKAGLIPTDLEKLLPNELCMIAGGPFANLCFGLLALCAALTAFGRPWERAGELLALIAMISVISGISNLIPVRVQNYYSDGAHIYNLLTKGPALDLLRARSSVTLTLVTPRRPRDYDMEAIQQAALSYTEEHEGTLLRLWMSSYFLDRGQIPEAIQAMLEAETICEHCYATIRGELLASFVFDHALFRRDVERARLWWDRLEARKPDPDSIDPWWARTALLWIEGHLDEAREALRKGEALTEQLPKFGAFDFDRYRFDLVREAIKTGSSAIDMAQEQLSTANLLI
jgi:Peptidase family M50